MSYYIVITKMDVKNANVLTSNYALTPTPIMACHLFAHALSRSIDVEDNGIAIIHHNWRLHTGENPGRVGLQQRRAASYIDKNDYSGGGMSLSLQPVATADLSISLIIEVDDRPDRDDIEEFMRSARLSGGVVQSYKSIEVVSKSEGIDGSVPPNGFWLIDRSDLIESDDPGTRVAELLSKKTPKVDQEEDWSEENHSFLSPIVPAYALTSDLGKDLSGIRCLDDMTTPEHAFCEPLLGLGQYVSIRRYKHNIPFWKARWENHNLYLLQQKTDH